MRAADLLAQYRKKVNPPYKIRDLIVVLGTLFLLVALPLTVYLTNQSRSPASRAQPQQAPGIKAVKSETLKLMKLNSKFVKAKDNKKQDILNEMAAVSSSRKKGMQSIIKTNPEEVLKLSFPRKVRSGFPTQVQKNLEQEISVAGVLELLVLDDFKNKKSKTEYFLRADKKRFTLYPTKTLSVTSGSKIKVAGMKIGNSIVFEPGIGQKSKVQSAVSNTLGEQKIVVILVNFQDEAIQPFTRNEASSVVFDTVNDFYQEVSFNKTHFGGGINDVHGWYTLPISKDLACDWGIVLDSAMEAADSDVYFPDYSRIIIAQPMPCGWAGLGSVGDWMISTPDGNVLTSISWISANFFDLRIIGHELGHNYGASHANAWECGASAIGGSCTSVDYYDPYDIMGYGTYTGHFSSFNKDYFEWLEPGNVQFVDTSASVNMDPVEIQTSGVQLVKIPKEKDINGNPTFYYFLEFRKAVGQDSTLPGNVFDGTSIRWGPYYSGENGTQLIDNTPGSNGSTWLDAQDGVLGVASTFTDSTAGVEVTTTSKTTDNIAVQIDVGSPTCVRSNPMVSINPKSAFAQPGSTVAYSVSITNNDTVVCGPSDFALSYEIPNLWNAGFSVNPLTVDPGTSSSSSLSVTSDLGALDEFYDIIVNATNSSATSFGGVDTATYVVSSDTEPPEVSIIAPIDGSIVSGVADITVSATDNVRVTQVEFLINGDPISSDSSAPYVYPWNTANFTDDIYTISAKAYDGANNVGTSIVVTVTVDNTFPPKPGDINGDGVVNIFDASILASKWGTNDPDADLNGNGVVDIFDASIMASNWDG